MFAIPHLVGEPALPNVRTLRSTGIVVGVRSGIAKVVEALALSNRQNSRIAAMPASLHQFC